MAAIGATLPGADWQRYRRHYTTNLMAITPKPYWPWVRTLLHAVFDRPDKESVTAQYDRIIDTLTDKPKVAEHLEDARADLMAFTAFLNHLATNLVEQPPGTPQQANPPPHRRRRHLPRPKRADPARRRRAGRTTRRMGRIAGATSVWTS